MRQCSKVIFLLNCLYAHNFLVVACNKLYQCYVYWSCSLTLNIPIISGGYTSQGFCQNNVVETSILQNVPNYSEPSSGSVTVLYTCLCYKSTCVPIVQAEPVFHHPSFPSVHHQGATKLTIAGQIVCTGWDSKDKFAELQVDCFNFWAQIHCSDPIFHFHTRVFGIRVSQSLHSRFGFGWPSIIVCLIKRNNALLA